MPGRRERIRATLRDGRRNWYKISNDASAGVAIVSIYDEIGYFGITAADFVAELSAVDASAIDLHIGSPGGEVFDGFTIFEALVAHRARVTTYVDSLAASIASVIAMAGDRVIMAPYAEMMIHDAFGLCVGNADDMARMVEDLNRQSVKIASVYADRAGGTVKQWRARMQAESWFNAQEAVDAGLADEAAKPKKKMPPGMPPEPMPMDNSWDLSVFRYQGRDKAPDPHAAADVPGVAAVEDAAVGPHGGTGKEGTWDASAEQAKLPSPMTVATCRNMYALYDSARVENGELPKDACSLPHHFVNTDGTPGAASLSGVSAALGRLNQTQGYTDAEKATAERHLRGHQPNDNASGHHTHNDNDDGEVVEVIPWDSAASTVFKAALATAADDFAGWDAEAFRHAVRVNADNAAATRPPTVVDPPYEPPPAPAPTVEPGPADPAFVYDPAAFRDAVRVRAEDAPAAAHAPPTEPAYEPPPPDLPPADPPAPPPVEGFEAYDPDVFRASVKLRADNAPAAPAGQQEQHQQQDPYDGTVVTRALREAAR